MSEHSISLVRLDIVPVPVTATIADAIGDWLLERGVIAVNDRVDRLRQSSAWKPGPGAIEVADASWFDAEIGLRACL